MDKFQLTFGTSGIMVPVEMTLVWQKEKAMYGVGIIKGDVEGDVLGVIGGDDRFYSLLSISLFETIPFRCSHLALSTQSLFLFLHRRCASFQS